MRKLKLQMFMSLDGFVAESDEATDPDSPTPEKPPATEPDEKMSQYIQWMMDTADTILLGRKTIGDFTSYWENVANNQPDSPEFTAAKKLVATPKVVFSKTLKQSVWHNTTLATGDLAEEVNRLKRQSGQDIIVYGGGGFVSSLIKERLIDEYHLFINPHALGAGMPIFHRLTRSLNLKLKSATAFGNGVALLVYDFQSD